MVKDLRREISDESVLEKIAQEIKRVGQLIVNPLQAMTSGFYFHKVELNGETYWAADAKSVNRTLGSRGRGNYRHLIDSRTRQYVGIAEHTSSGGYRLVFSFAQD